MLKHSDWYGGLSYWIIGCLSENQIIQVPMLMKKALLLCLKQFIFSTSYLIVKELKETRGLSFQTWQGSLKIPVHAGVYH
jgi:hypothetical protein